MNKGIILVVDDQPLMVKLILAVLDGCGFEVLGIENPAQAVTVAAAKGERVRLLITDLRMGGMSGTELATRVMAHCPEARVLFMSGAEAEELGLSADSRHDFIRKPFPNGELLRRIEALIGTPSQDETPARHTG